MAQHELIVNEPYDSLVLIRRRVQSGGYETEIPTTYTRVQTVHRGRCLKGIGVTCLQFDDGAHIRPSR